ncbi:hypothetical protein J8L70_09300 [Pseudoalteromonas sp. MMG010]|uniref:hypothetical protein n=1 Tax=Pseudoalteromonas sp. MMG010 TaxID=2822685 RepID=UPI001B3A3E58|nr:hypothetical protein [Pseudoalteromonas sp. MMG010]MBQ4833432.1 hypothetical protein [Pseudoalteromonas sp. MMG010]
MKNVIKLIAASVLLIGTSHAQAVEIELDITRLLNESVSRFVQQTSLELESSLKESLNFDTHFVLDNLFEPRYAKQQSVTQENFSKKINVHTEDSVDE